MPTAEPCNKHNYNGKGRYFLGYLQRRQSKMGEETHHLQVMPKMLNFNHATNCESVRIKKKRNSFSVSSGCKVPNEEMRRSSVLHCNRQFFFINFVSSRDFQRHRTCHYILLLTTLSNYETFL